VFVPGGQLLKVDSRQQGQRARTHAGQTLSVVSELHNDVKKHVIRQKLKFVVALLSGLNVQFTIFFMLFLGKLLMMMIMMMDDFYSVLHNSDVCSCVD